MADNAMEMKELAVIIERTFARPDTLNDLPPFAAVIVAPIVILLTCPEHIELVLVPSADDVQAEAALAHMIGSDGLLGSEHRMNQRAMHGAEHRDIARDGEQTARPCDGLKGAALEIGLAAVTFPASHRHHAFDARLIGHLRQLDVVRPARVPSFGHLGCGHSARTVRREDADLHPIAIEHRMIAPAVAGCRRERVRSVSHRSTSPSILSYRIRDRAQSSSADAEPTTVLVPSAFSHQTSVSARLRRPSGRRSTTIPLAPVVSPHHRTLTSFTSIRPPQMKPTPNRRVIISAIMQTDSIPCTTISGKPSSRAASRSLW